MRKSLTIIGVLMIPALSVACWFAWSNRIDKTNADDLLTQYTICQVGIAFAYRGGDDKVIPVDVWEVPWRGVGVESKSHEAKRKIWTDLGATVVITKVYRDQRQPPDDPWLRMGNISEGFTRFREWERDNEGIAIRRPDGSLDWGSYSAGDWADDGVIDMGATTNNNEGRWPRWMRRFIG